MYVVSTILLPRISMNFGILIKNLIDWYGKALFMQGNILYIFPSLQRTASSQRSGRKEYVGRRWADWVVGVEKFFQEKKWEFRFIISSIYLLEFFYDRVPLTIGMLLPCSKTSMNERAMVVGLGGVNLFGVVILGAMLK